MKLSVSLSEDDVAFLDRVSDARALGSRSAAVQHAVRALRMEELAAAYDDAWTSWAADGGGAWDAAAADGI